MSHKGEGDLKEGSDKNSHRMGYQEKNIMVDMLKAEEKLSWMTQHFFFHKCCKISVQRSFHKARKNVGGGAFRNSHRQLTW